MDFSITSQEKDGYLLVISKGTISEPHDLNLHGEMIYLEIAKYGYSRILIDDVETTFPSDLFNYFDLPNHYEEHLPISVKSLKIAVLVSVNDKKLGEFWTLICTNRGFNAASFTDSEEARLWLVK